MKVQLRTDEPGHSDVTTRKPLAISPRAVISGAAVLLAGLIVALILTPAGAWHQPAIDAVYRGFDPNLMFISPTGPAANAGEITTSPDKLAIVAKNDSHPTVQLVTTPLSFSTAIDAVVIAGPAQTIPLQIELWSAESNSGYALVFDPAGVIKAEIITNGTALQDLVGGMSRSSDVGPFQVGQAYHVFLNVDQTRQTITADVSGPGLPQAESTVTSADAPQLFKAFRYTFTVAAASKSGSTSAYVQNFILTVPHQASSTAEETVKVDDARARVLVQTLLGAAIVLLFVFFLPRAWATLRRQSRDGLPQIFSALKARAPALAVLAVVMLLYLTANSALFPIGSLHYDVLSSKVWAYVANKDGLPDLYYRTLLVPASAAWSGVPLHEAGFPYGITKAYYYLTVGWIYHLWPGASSVPVNDFSFEAVLKSLNVLFGFADSVLTYLIMKRFVSKPSALTSALLLALNPAVVLVMSIWGSTETISLFFVLSAILFAETNRPLGAWLMLAAAAYTRPQMLVLAFLLGAVLLRKFGATRNLMAISWTVVAAFIVMAPFALAISPSVPIDWVARTLIFHFGNGQADLPYLGTSPGYYSVWTLPLLLVNGQHGLDRMWSPSTQHLLGNFSYGQVGAVLSVTFVLVIGGVLLFTKRVSEQAGQYLPLVACGMLGWLMLTPGLISRYFVYGIVLTILCRRVFSTSGYIFVLAVLTSITVVTAYGHLGSDFLGYSGSAGVLSPTNNSFSEFVFNLFSTDWFITLGTAANIGILVVLATKAWETIRSSRPPELGPVAAVSAT